jgi:hypothetical protein
LAGSVTSTMALPTGIPVKEYAPLLSVSVV